MITLVSSLLGLGPTLMHRTVACIDRNGNKKIRGLVKPEYKVSTYLQHEEDSFSTSDEAGLDPHLDVSRFP